MPSGTFIPDSPELRARIVAAYNKGIGINMIAYNLQVGNGRVRKYLVEEGVELRKVGYSFRGRKY